MTSSIFPELTLTQISFRCEQGVGYLRLECPERLNAQSVQMWSELAEVADVVDQMTPPLRCLIVQGAGRSFCAGIDLAEIATADGSLHQVGQAARQPDQDPLLDLIDQTQLWFRWLHNLDCVTIAAIQGHALGAGLQLAMACDIRVLANNAVLGLPEMSYGLVPDLGATEWLPDIVGEGIARDMIFTGRRLDAAEAMQVGLGSRLVPEVELDREIAEITATLLAATPAGISSIKAALAHRGDPIEGWSSIAKGQAACIRSVQVQERMALVLAELDGTESGR